MIFTAPKNTKNLLPIFIRHETAPHRQPAAIAGHAKRQKSREMPNFSGFFHIQAKEPKKSACQRTAKCDHILA
jgi:hypothetical protein